MSDYSSFHFPGMLTATPSNGPTAFVAINGMLSVAGTGPQLTGNPLFTVPPNFGASSFISNSNISPTPFILPSAAFPPNPNLTCTTSPFSSPQFQSSLFPFLTSANTVMFPGGSSIAIPPLPQLLQPQSSSNPLNPFTSTMAVTSVLGSFGSQPLLPDTTPLSLTASASNALSGNFSTHSLMPSTSTFGDLSTSVSAVGDGLTFPRGSAASANASNPSSLSVPNPSGSTIVQTACAYSHSYSSSSTTLIPSTAASSVSSVQSTEPVHISPSLQNTFKIDKSRPVAPNTLSTSRAHPSNNLLSLESVDFHRDDILDAIDKLRERKARPDFERISCMLKRHRNINPDQTQLCLGRLAASGAVVCVDYKGNISYRNPSKWRKTSVNLGTTNPPNVSQRLIDAVRHLMVSATTGIPNGDSPTVSQIAAPSGPNGGYSLFQIERALQTLKPDHAATAKSGPELTGATLRVCLDREAVNGKLAKTPDGRYILDESGERKKLANIAVGPAPPLFNKKPLPPNGSTLLLPVNMNQKYGKSSSSVACIAPAGDLLSRPLMAKQTAVSIAPLGGKPLGISPLPNAPRRPTVGRRGRPPGSKGRRFSLSSTNACTPEKKPRFEPPLSCIGSSSSDALINSATSSPKNHGNGSNAINSKFTTVSTVIPANQACFNSSSALSISAPFINGAVSSFSNPHSTDTSAFGGHFLFSSCPAAMTSCSLSTTELTPILIPTSLPSLSCNLPLLSKNDGPDDSPIITLLANLDSVETDTSEVKSENEFENLCVHCGTQPTIEEPFLVCKDCGTRAHPTCLDYWPELTERARQTAWQCAECKTCSVCQDVQCTTDLLVCDACDKGFHPGCHHPKLQEPVDRSLPWVCSDCRNEGYSVAIGTMPNDVNTQSDYPDEVVEQNDTASHSEQEDTDVNVTEIEDDAPQADLPTINPSPRSQDINAESALAGHAHTSALCSLIQDHSSDGTSDCPVSFKSLPPPQPIEFENNHDESSSSPLSTSHESITCLRPPSSSPRQPHSHIDPLPDLADDRPCPERMNSVDLSEGLSHNDEKPSVRPTDIRAWSMEHVRDWLLDEGFTREAEAFHQQEIDGACLLLMKRMDVLTELGIKLGPAVKIYERIKRLQSICTSSSPLSV